MDEIVRLLEEVTELLSKRQYREALNYCDRAAELAPENASVYRRRAHVHAILKDWAAAVSDVDLAMTLSKDARDPGDYAFAGMWRLILEHYYEAVEYLTTAIRLETERSENYYWETTHFLRAEALFATGRPQEAAQDCSKVSAGFQIYLGGRLRKREDLIARINGTPA